MIIREEIQAQMPVRLCLIEESHAHTSKALVIFLSYAFPQMQIFQSESINLRLLHFCLA